MSAAVFNEPIDTYARSPDEMDSYLAHYGIKGQKWGVHRFGKWQNQAVYAIGDQRHIDGTPIEPGTKYGGRVKDVLEDKLKSKAGTTPRVNFDELSTDEIIAKTNRLSKENAYLREMQAASKLDKEFIDATSRTGLIDKAASTLIDTSTKFFRNSSRAAMYETLKGAVGEEAAQMIMFDKVPSGKEKKKDKDENKSNPQQQQPKKNETMNEYRKRRRAEVKAELDKEEVDAEIDEYKKKEREKRKKDKQSQEQEQTQQEENPSSSNKRDKAFNSNHHTIDLKDWDFDNDGELDKNEFSAIIANMDDAWHNIKYSGIRPYLSDSSIKALQNAVGKSWSSVEKVPISFYTVSK